MTMWNFLSFVGGALISWLIARHFYKRAETDLKASNDRFVKNLKWENTEEYFKSMLSSGDWELRGIGGNRSWVCRQDSNLIIEEDDETEKFDEDWTKPFPDPQAFKFTVRLKRNGSVFKEMIFISVDGHRITVPLPRVIATSGQPITNPIPIYFWDKNTIDYKVGQIIGAYYIYENLQGVAKHCGVEIVNGQLRT